MKRRAKADTLTARVREMRARKLENQQRMRLKRLAEGLCMRCGKEPLYTRNHCEACRVIVNDLQRARRHENRPKHNAICREWRVKAKRRARLADVVLDQGEVRDWSQSTLDERVAHD